MVRVLSSLMSAVALLLVLASAAFAGVGAGQWGIDTALVTSGTFDPIVAPGDPMFGHCHDGFGNRGFSPYQTTPSLWLGTTNSSDSLDKSSRWVPCMVTDADGTLVTPIKNHVYYRKGSEADVRVQPLPQGLRVIAGNSKATAYQSATVVSWQCSTGGGYVVPPQSCGGGKLQALVKFPNCWNGEALDSVDHKSHMAYQDLATKTCPDSHPIRVPQIQQVVTWPIDGIAGHHLSSDDPSMDGIADVPPGTTMHADNVFLWDGLEMARLCNLCLNDSPHDCATITVPAT